MNRQTILGVGTIAALLTLVYVLPMLGLSFAVDHGLYVAAASVAVPFLRADRLERVVEVLDYHQHGSERCSMVLLEVDGAPWYTYVLFVVFGAIAVSGVLLLEREQTTDEIQASKKRALGEAAGGAGDATR